LYDNFLNKLEKFTKNEIDGEEMFREFQKRNLLVKDIHSIHENIKPLEEKKTSIMENTQQRIREVVIKHQQEGKKRIRRCPVPFSCSHGPIGEISRHSTTIREMESENV